MTERVELTFDGGCKLLNDLKYSASFHSFWLVVIAVILAMCSDKLTQIRDVQNQQLAVLERVAAELHTPPPAK